MIESTTTTHIATGGTTTVLEEFTYDHQDRPTTIEHKVNSEPKVTLSEFTYNLVGQMIEKDLHGGAAQSVDYAYNERGWIKTINGGMAGDGDANDQFFMELKYDDAPTPQYGGNIGQMLWKTMGFSGNENQQSYDYAYDNLNRLKRATYNSSGKANHFNLDGDNNGVRYDLNGNIKNLQRHHEGTLIDNLSFSHFGNRITSAGDAALDTGEGFVEASNGLVANEYSYDANGNITKDDNKGLTDIDYNILNLPRQVTQSNGDVITYVYDAAGAKLAKTVDDGSPETTYYDGPFHYIGNDLQFIQTAEGRAREDQGNFLYEYNLTDHLGNVRVSVNASGAVVQRDGYYPFGLTFNHSNVSPENEYKLTGNEEQKEWGVYDFNARMYDPALGRFGSVDPLADLQSAYTPYHYSYNNPVRFTDVTGLMPNKQADQHHVADRASASTDDVDPDELWRDVYEEDGVTYIDIYYRGELTTGSRHNTVAGGGGFGEGHMGSIFQQVPGIKFSDLWRQYPSGSIKHINPETGLDCFGNHCAINVSQALQRAGASMKSFKGTKCWFCTSEEWHVIRAQELADWLKGQSIKGISAVKVLNGENFEEYVTGKQGIVFFQNYWQREGQTGRTGDHIDLWNKNQLKSIGLFGSWMRSTFPSFSENYLNMSDLKRSTQVLFWEIK